MTTYSHIRHASAQRPVKKGFFQIISIAYDICKQRRVLAQLDATALNDIGLTRREADQEANKPVWNLPQTCWR